MKPTFIETFPVFKIKRNCLKIVHIQKRACFRKEMWEGLSRQLTAVVIENALKD